MKGFLFPRRLACNFEREFMRSMAVHRRKAQKLWVDAGGGDLCFGFRLAIASEKGGKTCKIICCCGRASFLAEGAALAERCFKEAAVLAGQRGKGMFAKIAACHQGGGNAGNGQHFANGEGANDGCRATRKAEHPEARQRHGERPGQSREKAAMDFLCHTHAPNQQVM